MGRTPFLCLVAAALVALASLPAPQAFAQTRNPGTTTRQETFPFGRTSRTTPPPVARYSADGVAEFVFDTSGARPMLRFNGNTEIFALTSQPAPRGDVIYKNDVDEVMLRSSRLGGLTVFTAAKPDGAPAQLIDGPVTPIRLDPVLNLNSRLNQASVRIQRALNKGLGIEADGSGTPVSDSLIVDVLNLTADAIGRLKGGRNAARVPQIDTVSVKEGATPTVQYGDKTLRITIAPTWGAAGRPSSERISRALTLR